MHIPTFVFIFILFRTLILLLLLYPKHVIKPSGYNLGCYRERLLQVGYLGRLAGLTPQGGWHDSNSCFGSIPSVTKNSILFVEEQSFP